MLLDPIEYNIDLTSKQSVYGWRIFLGQQITRKRGYKCERCKCMGEISDLAEGFVSRGDVRGWKVEKRGLIFHEFNCLILCRDCHKVHGFDRDWAWNYACKLYGEEKVREWYEGLPWKAGVPRRFWDAD